MKSRISKCIDIWSAKRSKIHVTIEKRFDEKEKGTAIQATKAKPQTVTRHQ